MATKLLYAALVACLLMPNTATAQSLQFRVGAMFFSPLVEDEVSSSAVENQFPSEQAHRIRVQQAIGAALTGVVVYPLRPNLDAEISATYATSKLNAEDSFESWDAGSVSVANALFGIGYKWRSSLSFHAGAGLTKLFGSDAGMFSEGNGIQPLLEAGASLNLGRLPFAFDVRAQTHSFSTRTLTDEQASPGNIFRVVVGASYTFGGAR